LHQQGTENAQQRENIRPIIDQIMSSGVVSLRAIAVALMVCGVKTASGRSRWHPEQVATILKLACK